MPKQIVESIYLAWRDWKYEFLLSLCAVLALASMLTPILVLQGLKNGLISEMRNRLLEDPGIMIITPKSDAGQFSRGFIQKLGALPGARFAIGRTRETSTDITLLNPDTSSRASIAFEPAAQGEPILQKYHINVPANGKEPQITLSTPASRSLKANVGDKLNASIGRRTPEGRLESFPLVLHVNGILPVEAADRKMAFAPLDLLEELENYRDYIAVPERDLAGNEPRGERKYSSFRLYASSLEDVEKLAGEMRSQNIEVNTRDREIAAIRMLEEAINKVILIISLAVGCGFVAFTISSAESAVRRKKRMLGLLRLLGFDRLPLMCYPLAQTVLTAIAGFILALVAYYGASRLVLHIFSSQGIKACFLGFDDLCIWGAAIIVLSLVSCARPAFSAARVEPSTVIREV